MEPCRYKVMAGGRGCIGAETKLVTPSGLCRVDEFKGGVVYAFDNGRRVEAIAGRPIKYAAEPLIRITMQDGSSIRVTARHQFLAATGWTFAHELSSGMQVLVSSLPSISFLPEISSPSPPDLCFSASLSASPLGVPHCLRILLGSLYCYSAYFRRCGLLPPLAPDTYLGVIRQLADELPHMNHAWTHGDDMEFYGIHSLLLSLPLPSIGDAFLAWGQQYFEISGNQIDATFFEPLLESLRPLQLSPQSKALPGLIRKFALQLQDFWSFVSEIEKLASQNFSSLQRLSACDIPEILGLFGLVDDTSYSSKFNGCNLSPHYVLRKVESIELLSEETFYDLFVPFFNNYETEGGFVNHNSGKSFAAADALLILGIKGRIRVLCAREFQNSIKESVHALLSDRILDLGFDDFYTISREGISGKNGTIFIFKGVARNTQSIKSMAGITHLWIEEGQTITHDSWEVLTPTVREEGSEIWVTMNPENEDDPIYFEFIENETSGAWVEAVNWNRNPYFTEVLEQERLRMMSLYPEEVYKHIWEGEIRRDSDDWQVIPTAWVEAAQQRWLDAPRPSTPMSAIGVDVARGGKDQTILAPRYEWWYDELISYPGSATPNGPMVAAQVVQNLRPGAIALIDVVGVGASVYDCCVGVEAYPVSAGTAAQNAMGIPYMDETEMYEFVNLRSWIAWRFRELLNPETGVDMCLPPNKRLKADLCAPRWKLLPPTANSRAKGRIAVESKDEIKKRLGRSTDEGDAVQYASLDRDHFTQVYGWGHGTVRYGR